MSIFDGYYLIFFIFKQKINLFNKKLKIISIMKVYNFKNYFLIFITIFSLISYSSENLTSAVTGAVTGAVSSAINSTLATVNSTITTGLNGTIAAVNSTIGDISSQVGNLANSSLGNITDQMSGLMGSVNETFDNFTFSMDYFRQMINAIPLVPVPNASSILNVDSTSFKTTFQDSSERVNGEFGLYYMNNCTDDRVPSLFGDALGTPEASNDCMMLVYDFMQLYAPYKCNDFLCNFQGKCSFKTDDQEVVIPSCSCNTGFSGLSCMYNTTTYTNSDQWITLTKTWLDNYISSKTNNGTITDAKVISDLLDIVEQILMFSSNANPSDSDKYASYVSSFGNAIINSNVTMNPELEDKLYGFMDFIMTKVDGNLQGVDPTQVVGMTNETVKVTDSYALQKADIPTDKDLNLSPKDSVASGKSPSLRFLQDLAVNPKYYIENFNSLRSLQTKSQITSTSIKKKTVNQDSAKAILPMNVNAAFPNSTVTFVLFKDPSSMTQTNSVAITSQVVNLKVVNKVTNAPIPYPSNSSSYQIYLPWTQVPYNILNNQYVNNCKVYSFDQKTWVETKSCTISATTNSTAANIDCKTFGTLGVSCKGASVVAKKTTGSSLISLASYLAYAIIGLILF